MLYNGGINSDRGVEKRQKGRVREGGISCEQSHRRVENGFKSLKVRLGTLTSQVDNAGDDNDRPSY